MITITILLFHVGVVDKKVLTRGLSYCDMGRSIHSSPCRFCHLDLFYPFSRTPGNSFIFSIYTPLLFLAVLPDLCALVSTRRATHPHLYSLPHLAQPPLTLSSFLNWCLRTYRIFTASRSRCPIFFFDFAAIDSIFFDFDVLFFPFFDKRSPSHPNLLISRNF